MKSELRVGAFWTRVVLDAIKGAGFDAWDYWRKRKLLTPSDDLTDAVPYSELHRLWRVALKETGDPLLGLHSAASLPVQMPNIFAYLLLAAPTLREGLALTIRFQPLVLNARVSSFEDRGDHFNWSYTLPGDPPPLPAQSEYAVTIIMRMAAFIGGPTYRARSINFPHPPQGELSEYERILAGPVSFLAPAASIVFDREAVSHPNPLANANTLRMLVETAENLMAQRGGENWTARVSAALQPVLSRKNCTLDDIAHAMHVSTRTLQRNLATENTTFQDLLDDVRRRRALELVMQPQIPLAQVAQETGFADARAFNRAFQRWTGQAPSIYREARLPGGRPQLRAVGK
jgi:AraC-like DNA-binding protein